MTVIGMGEQKTPNSLVSACEKFKYLDLLYQENEEGEEESEGSQEISHEEDKGGAKTSGAQKASAGSRHETKEEAKEEESSFVTAIPTMKEIGAEIRSIIDLKSGDDGWVDLSEIGVSLSRRVPGFDPRNYKYTKLSKLIKGFAFVETKEVRNPNNKLLKSIYVRIR